jgi:hypothetical protein
MSFDQLPASIRTPSKMTAPSNRAPGPISAPRPMTVPPMFSKSFAAFLFFGVRTRYLNEA